MDEHHFEGDRPANQKDMGEKGRSPWGEANHFARLTVEQVYEIRAGCDRGVPQKMFVERFGVSSGQISLIARRLSWRHLEERGTR